MIISMIAAMGKNRVIGKDNQMMWHLPLEYKYFKDTTMGHHIILGRKNYEAIGRPLPGRTNIIVSRNPEFKAPGFVVASSLEAAIEFARENRDDEVFITGGGQIYELGLPLSDRIYLTEVDFEIEGDVYFPHFDESLYSKTLIHDEPKGDKNKFAWKAYLYKKL